MLPTMLTQPLASHNHATHNDDLTLAVVWKRHSLADYCIDQGHIKYRVTHAPCVLLAITHHIIQFFEK